MTPWISSHGQLSEHHCLSGFRGHKDQDGAETFAASGIYVGSSFKENDLDSLDTWTNALSPSSLKGFPQNKTKLRRKLVFARGRKWEKMGEGQGLGCDTLPDII